MFRDGVVWGLASMSRSKDVTIAGLCSVALCNLTCEYWKDIGMSNNCMQVGAASALIQRSVSALSYSFLGSSA